MAILNLDQARVIDPILTKQVQLGPSQGDYVGNLAFPTVPVTVRSGRIIKFGDDAFALIDTRRAPGARTKRRALTYSSDKYTLYQDKIEGELPIEFLEEVQANQVPIDLQLMTVDLAKQTIDLRLEYDQLTLLSDPNAYSTLFKVVLSGTSQWSSAASSPKTAVNIGKQAIRKAIGKYPNTAIFSSGILDALDVHPDIRDQFKYTNDNSLTTDMLKRYFNLENLGVATALVIDPTSGIKVDILANQFWLGYVNPSPAPNMITPSFGYTYTLKGFPIALPAYWGENEETWYFPVKAERDPVITFPGAGFLFQNVI
ncbi:major capsid protein [Nostoc sp.]